LHLRVVTEIVERAVSEVAFLCNPNHFRSLAGKERQRLLAQHVLAGFHRSLCHREMQRVRGADVNGINGGIGQ